MLTIHPEVQTFGIQNLQLLHTFQLNIQWHFNTKGSMVSLHKDDFKLSWEVLKSWWKHYWLNTVKVIMQKSLAKWERVKQKTVLPYSSGGKDFGNKENMSEFCIFIADQNIQQNMTSKPCASFKLFILLYQ